MFRWFHKLRLGYERFVWHTDLHRAPRGPRTLMRTLRIAAVVWRDTAHGQLSPQAMSLVYTALLALIPLLAVTFSVLKTFGVHNQIEPILLNFLAPLEAKGVELTRQLLQFVSRMKVGVLGALGLAMLIYTSLLLIHKIDQSFNAIWHIKRGRHITRRLGDYLTVTIIGPLLFFLALGFTASVASSSLLKPLLGFTTGAAKLLPYFLGTGAFFFLYIFIPNTKVRLRSALIGALVAGILWQAAGSLFAAFLAGSTQYRAVYASFAIGILFLIWLYVSCLITLIGAAIAFYHQHPEHITREPREISALLSNRRRERLGLRLARLIGEYYYAGRGPLSADVMARRLQAALAAIEYLLASFVTHKLLVTNQGSPETYLPARPLETVALADVVHAIHAAGIESTYEPPDPTVDDVIERLAESTEKSLAGKTWRDLIAKEATPALRAAPRRRLKS
jgi:membrane protein